MEDTRKMFLTIIILKAFSPSRFKLLHELNSLTSLNDMNLAMCIWQSAVSSSTCMKISPISIFELHSQKEGTKPPLCSSFSLSLSQPQHFFCALILQMCDRFQGCCFEDPLDWVHIITSNSSDVKPWSFVCVLMWIHYQHVSVLQFVNPLSNSMNSRYMCL